MTVFLCWPSKPEEDLKERGGSPCGDTAPFGR
jgi:hypothetical protein